MTAKRNYAPLDADELVPTANLGTGTPTGSKFLRDDQTFAVPAGAGGAPDDADYLVGTAHAGLSAEIVVGATPGGELGGTWPSPTVDASHSGSTHAATQAAAEATAAGALTTHAGAADPHTGYQKESEKDAANGYAGLNAGSIVPIARLATGTPDGTKFIRDDNTLGVPSGSGAPSDVDYLVGTASGGLSAEIVVGPTPGGELGGTWASPTVDATHSGSAHHTQSHDHSAAGDGTTLTPAHLNVPQETPGTTEGRIGWDATAHSLTGYDTQRARGGEIGWLPFAFPMYWSASAALSTSATLAANGGSICIPIHVIGHMLLQDVTLRNLDTATARTWGWDLYVNDLNNGNAGENTVRRVAASLADETFTPGAASTRTIAAASAPVYLPPGLYYLVIQNRHASNTFALGSTAAGNAFTKSAQTKTTTNPNGATLDLVAATWTTVTGIYAVRLSGRVTGMATAWG